MKKLQHPLSMFINVFFNNNESTTSNSSFSLNTFMFKFQSKQGTSVKSVILSTLKYWNPQKRRRYFVFGSHTSGSAHSLFGDWHNETNRIIKSISVAIWWDGIDPITGHSFFTSTLEWQTYLWMVLFPPWFSCIVCSNTVKAWLSERALYLLLSFLSVVYTLLRQSEEVEQVLLMT